MNLKVCGMRDPENIRRLVKVVNPDFVGLIFHPGSLRYFLDGPEEIPEALNPGKSVGVFVNSPYEEITGLAEMFALKNIQLHGRESPKLCFSLKEAGFTVIKAFGVSGPKDLWSLKDYSDVCDYFLFDTKTSKYGGSGKKFKWEILDGIDIPKPYFLSGGIDREDVPNIIKLENKPFAIDINSRFESEPGLKDIQKIKAFKNELFNHANTQNNG